MNEAQIQTFLEVAERGSMSAAAERLFITQPAVKKQMDGLEAELGVSLFVRTQQGCTLTRQGEHFLRRIRSIASDLASLKAEVYDLGHSSNILRVCALPHVISPHFEAIGRALASAHPDVELRYVPMPYADRPRLIGEERADVGIYFDVEDIVDRYDLTFHGTSKPGGGTQCHCLLDPNHALANRRRISVDDLRGVPIAVFDAHIFGRLARQLQAGEKTPVLKELSGNDFEVLSFCTGGGVYLCCYLAERYETLRAIPLDYRMPAEGFLTRKRPSQAVLWYLEAAHEVLGRA